MGDGGQLDLFFVTAVDPPWRDNRDAMEFPFVSLQKRRTTPIIYDDGNVWLSVGADSRFSIATIWDWDVMIFAASHINEAIESRRKISPRITFVPHDCLKQIGRPIGGEHYQRLADAIRRLHATSVITNIREADQPDTGEERGFHWLYGYSLPKRYPPRYITTPDNVAHITPRNPEGEPDPARPWVIHIHPWLYNAIVRRGDILAVHPDYFQLTGGLERWLYRLARKAVPDKAESPAIPFKMETLHARSGVTGTLNRFAFRIREIAEAQPLPEYGVQIEHKGRRELVTLYRDKAKPCRPPRGRRLKTIRGEQVEPAVNTDAYLENEDVFVIEPDTPMTAEKPVEQPVEAVSVQEQARALFVQTIEKLIKGADGERAACVFPDGSRLITEPLPGAAPPADLKTALREAMEEVLRKSAL
jgi:hypothetical protein